MTQERLNELISSLSLNMKTIVKSEDRKLIRKLQHENYCIQQARAIEYAARNNWKYVYEYPIEYLNRDSILSLSEIERKDFVINKGHSFTCRMLAEGKKANNYWQSDYDIDLYFMDHPHFYKDQENRPAAIIAHSYNMPDIKSDAEKYARSRGLNISYPSFPSWWNPGSTEIIEYKRG